MDDAGAEKAGAVTGVAVAADAPAVGAAELLLLMNGLNMVEPAMEGRGSSGASGVAAGSDAAAEEAAAEAAPESLLLTSCTSDEEEDDEASAVIPKLSSSIGGNPAGFPLRCAGDAAGELAVELLLVPSVLNCSPSTPQSARCSHSTACFSADGVVAAPVVAEADSGFFPRLSTKFAGEAAKLHLEMSTE